MPADQGPVFADPLNMKQRLMSGTIGLVAGGAGTAATFVDGSNAGGAPLPIGVGALFGYLAVTSQRLTRLKVGGAEAELAVTRFVEKVATDPDVPDQVKAEIAEAVAEAPLQLSPGASRQLRQATRSQAAGAVFESAVQFAITRMGLRTHSLMFDSGYDLVITDDNQMTVNVVLKFTSSPMTNRRIVEQIAERFSGRRVIPILLVTNRPLSAEAAAFLRTYGSELVLQP